MYYYIAVDLAKSPATSTVTAESDDLRSHSYLIDAN